MWWILLIYLVGIIAAWFLMAFINDLEGYDEKLDPNLMFTSWVLILACIVILASDSIKELSSDWKIFKPSLKYFKRK